MEYTIDAKNKKLGRLATEIALTLQGKKEATYQKHVESTAKVIVENASQIRIDGDKANKEYKRYSGYPGGLVMEKRKALQNRKGIAEVLKLTVKNMLPKNKQQSKLLQNLVVKE